MESCAVNGKMVGEIAVIFKWLSLKLKYRMFYRWYHNDCSGGHLGVKRTLLKIPERFYWVRCCDDVEDWCRKFTNCAAVKECSRGALKLYNVCPPWERIALDVAGPFPESESGNKYFMVVIDYFSQ
ncbi:unnamed protein product [Parnassius mnemosyne]|uniref:Integrase zinc-binding domain-containing protein n=1 Tax=Parnassius mnemosyne TaxID=213953 RepID=A0AAV1M4I4_9NEOP